MDQLSDDLPEPSDNGHGREEQEATDAARTRRRRRVAVAVTVLVAAIWGYALWYSLNRSVPEPLDDESYTTLVGLCTDMAVDLRDLDPVSVDDSMALRAERVVAENTIFTAFTQQARLVSPSDSDGAVALDAWIDDWEALIEARRTFASDMAAADPRNLVVPTEGRGRPVTLRMEEYARDHDLDVCSPVRLLAEIVDGERLYPELDSSG